MAEGNSGEILATLELLMTEFFHPSTSNERKRDIEIMLESFASQDNSWRHCLYFVDKSSNQYVNMFALNTIENIILKKWNKVTSEGKLHIRRCLWTHLANNHRKIPSFLRNKAIKIIVDIVRREYLFSHSDFLLDLFDEIRKGGQSAVLGLLFIRNMTEGFDTQGRLHNDLSFCKRSTVERVVLHQMPRLIFILTDILKQLSDNQDIYLDLTPDPPPSPERCEGALETNYPQSALLPDLLASRTNLQRPGSYDGVGEECIILTLNILQNLFVWLPVSTHLQPSVITIVFHWASVATQKKFSEEVCVAGMSALNELMYRRASPPGSEFALRLGNGIGKLLDYITNTDGSHTLANLSTEYIDKISDFLRMFVLKNLKQLEAEPEFDSMGFLALLFQFTFQVPKSSSFTLCLDIWSQFIDNLKKMDSLKYSDALMGLVNGILKKIQYQHNNAELILLDNESVNDDGETEWQTFLHHCIECIAKAAETSPLHIFNLVLEVWQESVSAYAMGVVSLYHLKDLATLTQLLGRLMPTLFHDCDEATGKQCLAQADRFLENLLVVLQRVSATDHRLLQMQPKPMIDAFVRVHADVLACVGGVIPYVSQGSFQPAVLLRAAAPLLLPPTREAPQVAFVLSHAAAHLLLSIAVSLRASDPLQHLGDLVSRSLAHLEPKTAAVVRQALCVMVLQCPAGGIQAPERIRQCSVLVEAWCTPIANIAGPLAGGASPPVTAVRQACAQSLPQLGQLLDYFMDHNTQTKKMLAVVVERPVQAALMAFQNSNGDGETSTLVLELFLSLLGSLHQQLGNDFVQQSIRMFLDVAKRQEQGALQRLLQVLCLCVEGGALPGETALAELLQLCVDHVLPTVQGSDADPDVTHSLFQLFGSILIDRWQYFYSSCVRLGWSPAIAAAEAGADDGLRVQHSAHFRALLQAIIASFLSDHIDVFRLNLGTLEKLNSRWKLYQKMVFKREMLSPLLSVLLGALVRGGAARLLQEEVAAVCYSLAAVDFSSYYSHFLPSFLASQPLPEPDVQELLKIGHSTDSPTFTYSFIAMVDDIRCLLGET